MATDRDEASESGMSTADDEDAVRVLNSGVARPEEVDPDFERELAALVAEHQGHVAAAAAVGLPHAVEPMGGPEGGSGDGSGGSVAFKVMLRRGGKEDKSRSVQVCTLHLTPPLPPVHIS